MGFTGFDDEMDVNQKTGACENGEKNGLSVVPARPKRMPFATWEVGGREYKLKLDTGTICRLEEKFKRNLLSLLDGGMPPLAIMLTIAQAAMKKYEHGVKYLDVQNLFDQYCDEGGTQLSFFTDVMMPIYKVSGFFSENQQEELDRKMEDAKDRM